MNLSVNRCRLYRAIPFCLHRLLFSETLFKLLQQEWPEGSVEEKVQRLLKTWEMEMFHKLRPEDQKCVHSQGFTGSTNGQTSWPHAGNTLPLNP
jgi:hypothetical protein